MKQLLEHQKSELESEKIRSRERDQRNQETIDDLKTDNNSLRDTLSRERSDKEKIIEDMQYEYEGTISTLKNKVDSLVSRNNIVEREIISIKESMALKEKEIKNLQERVRVTEER